MLLWTDSVSEASQAEEGRFRELPVTSARLTWSGKHSGGEAGREAARLSCPHQLCSGSAERRTPHQLTVVCNLTFPEPERHP